MRHSTTDTYQLKREVLSFSARLSTGAPRDWQKCTADMLYGALASESCILSRFADVLKEDICKKNTVERLARKLTEDMPAQIRDNYLAFVQEIADDTGPVFVDDTDIVKPYGKAFEHLGKVRDGGLSTINRTEKIRKWYSYRGRNEGGSHGRETSPPHLYRGVQKAAG